MIYNYSTWKKRLNRRMMAKDSPFILLFVLCRLWVDINRQKRPVVWSHLHRRSHWRHNDLQNDVTFRGVPRVREPACVLQVVPRSKEQPDTGQYEHPITGYNNVVLEGWAVLVILKTVLISFIEEDFCFDLENDQILMLKYIDFF